MDMEPVTAVQQPFDTSALSSLVQDAIYRLPGCDPLTIRKALQESMRRLCEHSGAMCERVHAVVGIDGRARAQTTYRATVLRAEAYDAYGREWRAAPDGSHGAVTERLCMAPGSPVEMFLRLVPERDTEEVTPGFIERWGDAILHGALALLLTMKGRPWSDPEAAKREDHEWHVALADSAIGDIPSTALPQRAGAW